MSNDPDRELFIQCRRKSGSWIVTCAEFPGLILTHKSLDICLRDFVPAVNKLIEVEKLMAGRKRSAHD